jgi:quinolinate synthase
MRLNTLEKVYQALVSGQPEIVMEESIREAALLPIQRMLAMS